MEQYTYCKYIDFNGTEFFTIVSLPNKEGKYPVVIFRDPYVDGAENMTEDALLQDASESAKPWNDRGYAYVCQHCRGRGRSGGDCIPYVNERADGLFLHDWIRQQCFYNGELYLCGASYTSAVHLVTAPFAPDIRGAVLEVMDYERYNGYYRNGFFKIDLHGGWYTGMYKHKSIPDKNYDPAMFNMLPLSEYSEKVFGEKDKYFDEALKHPSKDDAYWQSDEAGAYVHEAINNTTVPILFTTGWYDIFTGGIIDMWRSLSDNTRAISALAIQPYDHVGDPNTAPMRFCNGSLYESYGDYRIEWFDAVRGKCDFPIQQGKVTYYKIFGDEGYITDDFDEVKDSMKLSLGKGEISYIYDPDIKHPKFIGGLSCNFGGNVWQEKQDRDDVITLYTSEFEEDVYIKGKIKVKLTVRSDCEDTCFYIRTSLCKAEGDYGIRDDIQQISNFDPNYIPNSEIEIEYAFDEHCFVIHKGEKLRIDISSAARCLYVRHTNNRGLYSEQTKTKAANNTVILDKSQMILPIEKKD